MEYVYKFEQNSLKGEIKLKIPNAYERMAIAKSCIYFVDQTGELKKIDEFTSAEKLLKEVENRIIELKAEKTVLSTLIF